MNALVRAALRLIPDRWRASVARDLAEEAGRSGRRGARRSAWTVVQAVRIATTLRYRQLPQLYADGRLALRVFARDPGSSAAIVLTLALGIAATTVVFAVFNHLVFRPMPGVQDPATLVTIAFQPENRPRTWSSGSSASVALFQAADTELRSIAALAGAPDAAPVILRPGEEPRLFDVEVVAPGYLETLGVRAKLGRLLTSQETREPGHAVALISDVMWRHEFDGAPSVLGRVLGVNGRPFTIVGVVADYRGWGPTAANYVDIWLPEADVQPDKTSYAQLIARAKPGASLDAVQARLRRLYEPLRLTLDARNSDAVPWVYAGLRRGPNTSTLGVSFPLVLGIASLLTLLACANAANLLLARTTRRRHDLALRAAIGATRWRLIQSLLVEATVLAGVAVVGGLAFTFGLVRVLDGTRVFAAADALSGVSVDWRVAAFAAAIGAGTVLMFALAPIVSATRIDLRTVLQESSRSVTGSQAFRRVLVAVQIALSFLLMAGAGVFAHSLWNLRAIDIGMKPSGVFAFTLDPRLSGAGGATSEALRLRVLARLQETAGIDAVGTANPPAFWEDGRMSTRVRLATEQPEPMPLVETSVVSPDYFAAVGVPLVAGRTFVDADANASLSALARPAVISLSLSRALFGQQPAVGQRIAVGSFRGEWVRRRVVEVVGVVGDIKPTLTLRHPTPAVMLYEASDPALVASRVYVRSSLPLAILQGRVYQTIRSVSPQWPLVKPSTLTEEVERLIPEDVAFARLLMATAIVAILLGFAGVYAVTAYSVSERTREFGVRIALGASTAAVIRQAVRAVGVMALVGAVIGLVAFGVASRVIASRLYGVSRLDPMALIGSVVILAIVIVVATWWPARRATRIDPVVALRAD